MVGKNILYGDDDIRNRERVYQSLNERGYHVDIVDSAQGVVSRANTVLYDAIISDLDYSPNGAEGYRVMEQIRGIPSLKVIFTARSGFENVAEGLEAGADQVVTSKNLDGLIKLLEGELKGGEENGKNN